MHSSPFCVVYVTIPCFYALKLCLFEKHLNAGIHGSALEFAVRLDIAIDVAHAITYLHMYTGFLLILTNIMIFVMINF